jgi:hypothetical protein
MSSTRAKGSRRVKVELIISNQLLSGKQLITYNGGPCHCGTVI